MDREERVRIARGAFGMWADKPGPVMEWEWAALWKRAAKKGWYELRKYKVAWQLQKAIIRQMAEETAALRMELDRIISVPRRDETRTDTGLEPERIRFL